MAYSAPFIFCGELRLPGEVQNLNNQTCQKYSGIGGQAILEGIMMKNRQNYACAARKQDGSIALDVQKYVSLPEKYPVLALPLVRGVFSFVDSMVLGMRSLNWSAEIYAEENGEEEEPSAFEKWLDEKLGEKAEKVVMGVVMAFSFVLAICIFMLLPMFLSTLLKKMIQNEFLIAFLEGVLRILIFITYIKLISRMEDIRRTFMYHGAEHKCINCVEHGLPLTVENVMKSSKEHKRCGTSFILIVMVISILFFMVIRVDTLAMRALSRIVLIPVIAGVSYEFLRWTGTHDSVLVNILSRPGMWMQGLTTKEPTADMAEVAIAAVEEVFDWRAYLRENFGWEDPESGKEGAAEKNAAEKAAEDKAGKAAAEAEGVRTGKAAAEAEKTA